MANRIHVASWTGGVCCAVALACGGSPSSAPANQPPPRVLKSAERADWYRACWDKFNTKAWDDFKKCYGDSAEADPGDSGRPAARGADAIIADTRKQIEGFPDMRGDLQLVLVNAPNIGGIAVVTATHSQPMPNPDGTTTPATNKKIGQLFGHAIQTDDAGSKVLKEFEYSDSATMLAQLGLAKAPARPAMTATGTPPTIVVATSSATELGNVAARRKIIEEWNAHNATAVAAGIADDVVWHEAPLPNDMDKKGLMASLKEFWKGISDVKITADAVWGARDYVVLRGFVNGVNDGNIPSMGLKKTGKPVKLHFLEIDRFEGGKLKEGWLFYDGGALMQQLTSKTQP